MFVHVAVNFDVKVISRVLDIYFEFEFEFESCQFIVRDYCFSLNVSLTLPKLHN